MIRATLTIDQRKRVPLESGSGFTTVPDGTLTGDIEVVIDEDLLVRLYGFRALRNRTKRAIAANGAIKIRATNLQRETADDVLRRTTKIE